MNRNPFIDQAWRWLGEELERWAEVGQSAQFWWRDDDACDNGDALERLLRISRQRQIPLALAVIPSSLKAGLAETLQLHETVSCMKRFACCNTATRITVMPRPVSVKSN
jgi:hypothetical protein